MFGSQLEISLNFFLGSLNVKSVVLSCCDWHLLVVMFGWEPIETQEYLRKEGLFKLLFFFFFNKTSGKVGPF